MFSVDKLPNVLTGSSNSVQLTKTITEPLSFRRGDVLRALVVEKMNHNEVLLSTRGSILLAKSDLSLNAGDHLDLKVDETYPEILLRLMSPADADIIPYRSNLAMFRSSPQGLFSVIKNGLGLFQGDFQPITPFINKTEEDSILRMINSLIYSEKSLDNPLYLKEFITNIGYLLEKNLRKSSERATEKWKSSHLKSSKNLKSLLTELSSKLHRITEAAVSDLDPQLLESLKSLSSYADVSLETISNQQVVNVIGQEEDQGYYFQIPFQVDDDLRMADLFINFNDRYAKSTKRNDLLQFVLFLDMDALGDMMVNVTYNQKKLCGSFRCSRSDTRDFLLDYLGTLDDRLNSAGYGPNYFNVYLSSDLAKEKAEFIEDKIIYSKKVINCFA